MNLRKAKDELIKAMSGPYGKRWVYGQAVRTLMEALEAAQRELKANAEQRREYVAQTASERNFRAAAENDTGHVPVTGGEQREESGGFAATAVINDVIAERLRQIYVEGYSTEHDDHCPPGELAQAGAAYAWRAVQPFDVPPAAYPRDSHSFKHHSPRRALVIATALILAEIERIDRMAGKDTKHGGAPGFGNVMPPQGRRDADQ